MHIPFCKRKCIYCNFYSRIYDADMASSFTKILISQLSAISHSVHSVYLGGGTPSVIDRKLLKKLLLNLKNFSIITREGKTTLSPCYDLVNSTIVLKKQEEEIALPLRGTKKDLTYNTLVNYLGMERCELTVKSIDNVLGSISSSISKWNDLIDLSFLSAEMKIKYHDLLNARLITLKLWYANSNMNFL